MPTSLAVSHPISVSELAARKAPIQLVGASEGMKLLRSLAAAYGERYPDRVVLVPLGVGSGGGVAGVAAGRAHLARVARPLNAAERTAGLQERPLFQIPIAFYCNPVSEVSSVSNAQLRDLFTGRINNWKMLGGRDLDVKFIGREARSSVLQAVQSSIFGDDEALVCQSTRTALTDQNSLAMAEETFGAIGFGPYDSNMSIGTQVLSIDGVLPMSENYPANITVSMVWRKADLTDDVQEFLDFTASDSAHQMMEDFCVVPVK